MDVDLGLQNTAYRMTVKSDVKKGHCSKQASGMPVNGESGEIENKNTSLFRLRPVMDWGKGVPYAK